MASLLSIDKIAGTLERVLRSPQVDVPDKKAAKVATEMAEVLKDSTTMAAVPVKSMWLSKTGWVQIIAVLAMILAYFGIDFDAGTQAAVLSIIVAVQGVVTWVIKNWFTPSVTPNSVEGGK